MMNAVKFFATLAILSYYIFAVSAAEEKETPRDKRFPYYGGGLGLGYSGAYAAHPYTHSYGLGYSAYPAAYGAHVSHIGYGGLGGLGGLGGYGGYGGYGSYGSYGGYGAYPSYGHSLVHY